VQSCPDTKRFELRVVLFQFPKGEGPGAPGLG